METSRLLTKAEAADQLRISLAMLNRLLAKRCIPYIKVGARVLIRQNHIDNYLAKCEVSTSEEAAA